MHDPEPRQREEPQQHDGPEQLSHAAGPRPLEKEKREQNAGADRHDVGTDPRRDDAQAFDRRHDRNGRGDHAVAVEERRAENSKAKEDALRRPIRQGVAVRLDEADEGENPAFAVEVGHEDEDQIFDADHEDQRPEYERQDPEHFRLRRRQAVLGLEAFADRVERAGADIAVHHSEGGQGKKGEPRFFFFLLFFGRTLSALVARLVTRGEGGPLVLLFHSHRRDQRAESLCVLSPKRLRAELRSRSGPRNR
jgi:hypothetical protein